MKLETGTWVVIADGEKYLLLENIGDREFLHLKMVEHKTSENPAARELSTDRAGRQHDSARDLGGEVAAWGKSGMQETDWHRVAEDRFAEDLSARLERLAQAGRFSRLVVVADPRTLGTLRNAYGDRLAGVILAEIDKDLTNLPLDRIEASVGSWKEG